MKFLAYYYDLRYDDPIFNFQQLFLFSKLKKNNLFSIENQSVLNFMSSSNFPNISEETDYNHYFRFLKGHLLYSLILVPFFLVVNFLQISGFLGKTCLIT